MRLTSTVRLPFLALRIKKHITKSGQKHAAKSCDDYNKSFLACLIDRIQAHQNNRSGLRWAYSRTSGQPSMPAWNYKKDIPMSNLMIDSPATRYSPLDRNAGISEAQVLLSSRQHSHSPFLTSEVLVPQHARTVEQELIHYIEQAYPRTRRRG